MEKKVIDFGALEVYIKQIESIFKDNKLNIIEQDLILRQLHERVAQKIQQQRGEDMTQKMFDKMPLGNMVKKMLGKGEGEE